MSNISQNPDTTKQVTLLLEDLVVSVEQISANLREKPDEEIAADLKR